MPRPPRAAPVVLLASILAGCQPTSLTVSLGPASTALNETVVLQDAGARRDKVALIDVRGLITDAQRPGLFGAGDHPIDDLAARLARAESDRDVRAVIIRINSAGGTVTGSDTMYREIRRFARASGKPVVASLGEVAASGGYYVALAADEIVAMPTTLTGSVGVLIQTINVSEGLSMIGVRPRAVVSGPSKDMASPLGPMVEEHYQILQGVVDEFYDRFAGLVRERRGGSVGRVSNPPGSQVGPVSNRPGHRPTDSDGAGTALPRPGGLERALDGRILTGAQAARLGLVDSEGGVHEAFARAKDLAGLRSARLVKYHTRGERPRSAYADSPINPPAAGPGGGSSRGGGAEINVLRLDFGGYGSILGRGAGPNAYYLWVP